MKVARWRQEAVGGGTIQLFYSWDSHFFFIQHLLLLILYIFFLPLPYLKKYESWVHLPSLSVKSHRKI
jgi:hypothetical protein